MWDLLCRPIENTERHFCSENVTKHKTTFEANETSAGLTMDLLQTESLQPSDVLLVLLLRLFCSPFIETSWTASAAVCQPWQPGGEGEGGQQVLINWEERINDHWRNVQNRRGYSLITCRRHKMPFWSKRLVYNFTLYLLNVILEKKTC